MPAAAAGSACTHSFVRGLGDRVRFDRPEPDLNESTRPGDERDTTTPAAIATDLRAVALDDGVDPAGRDRLAAWLLANTTGDATIRAGVPAGRRVGDKTGTGSQGERNDTGVLFPPGRAPIVLAVHTAPDDPTPSRRTPPSRRPRGSSPPHPPRRRSSGGQEIRRT